MFPVSQRGGKVFFLWLEKTMHNSVVVSVLVLDLLDGLARNYYTVILFCLICCSLAM